jgi:hypothetical protein
MPLYDIAPNNPNAPPPPRDVAPGALPFPRFDGLPGRLVDATGAAVLYVVWCDTETGEVECYDRSRGALYLNARTLRVATTREMRPAPLQYLPPVALECSRAASFGG